MPAEASKIFFGFSYQSMPVAASLNYFKSGTRNTDSYVYYWDGENQLFANPEAIALTVEE